MKKKYTEPDFIGGEGPLTKTEEAALKTYFLKKKKKVKKVNAQPKPTPAPPSK
ncbi:hypothetical protein [Flavihumibacter profundi]|jgi:hypothetical protein|uniref:hypothetical protein n=1 Tax=Flavihumibacter profundi TaxID=2716883 RepID=UPI001CC6CFE5|nr:hypothetical protein [Flavihumibacter profundi]MBZ5859610.1 hypothetical protein [Flavihumibacter profundi]